MNALQEWSSRDDSKGKDERADAQIHLLCTKSGRGGDSMTRNDLTMLVPQVSHLPNDLGKTGKSTARIAITVMIIMWARQTVMKGRSRDIEETPGCAEATGADFDDTAVTVDATLS